MNIAERHVNDGFVYVVVAVSIDFPFHGHLGHIRVANEGDGERERGSYVPNIHTIVKIVKELGNLHSCQAYFSSANYSTSSSCGSIFYFRETFPVQLSLLLPY